MNWNELLMYAKIKQVEFIDNTRIPPQEKVFDERDSGDIFGYNTIRRLSQ